MRSFLVRLPRWREHATSVDEDSAFELVLAAVEWLVLGLLVPLAVLIVELPVAVVRGLLGRTGWVEAVCRWPSEIRITWRTSRGARRAVAAEITARLEHGYEGLTPDGAERVAMTRPPGTDDLGA